jgi:hypothetical protein
MRDLMPLTYASPGLPTPIPAEFRGQVRAYRERLKAAHAGTYCDRGASAAHDYLADLCKTSRRPDMALGRAFERWKAATIPEATLTMLEPCRIANHDGWMIGEPAAVASETRLAEWDCNAWEPGIDVLHHAVWATRKNARQRYRVTIFSRQAVTVSSHAIARFLQRAGGTPQEVMQCASSAILWCGGPESDQSKPVPLIIPTEIGAWMGSMLTMVGPDGERHRIAALRTFLDDDLMGAELSDAVQSLCDTPSWQSGGEQMLALAAACAETRFLART